MLMLTIIMLQQDEIGGVGGNGPAVWKEWKMNN